MTRLTSTDLCRCGSGKMYGECHEAFDNTVMRYRAQGYLLPPRNLIKTPEQIDGIRKSGVLNTSVLDLVAERIRAGVTTEEIDQWVYEYITDHGGIPATLNYLGYPKSCCTSINQVICHGIPDQRILQDGDIINVDVTTILNGYYADASRMFIVGDAPEKAKKLVRVTKECLDRALAEVKPFNSFNAIGKAIEPYAKQHGYSVVRDLGGHGIGLKFHEELFIDHYVKQGKGILMLPGLVFTIEPMINEGKYDCICLDDGWTVETRDGLLSAQWEYTVLVTDDGYEVLSS